MICDLKSTEQPLSMKTTSVLYNTTSSVEQVLWHGQELPESESPKANSGLPKECQQQEKYWKDWQHIDNWCKDHKLIWQACLCSLWQANHCTCSDQFCRILQHF